MDDLIIAVILLVLVVFLVIEFNKNIPLLSVLVLLVINKELILRYADLPEGVETHKFLEIYVRQKVPP